MDNAMAMEMDRMHKEYNKVQAKIDALDESIRVHERAISDHEDEIELLSDTISEWQDEADALCKKMIDGGYIRNESELHAPAYGTVYYE